MNRIDIEQLWKINYILTSSTKHVRKLKQNFEISEIKLYNLPIEYFNPFLIADASVAKPQTSAAVCCVAMCGRLGIAASATSSERERSAALAAE